MSEETLYIGHNNVMTKILKEDDVAIDYGSDKITLEIYDTGRLSPLYAFNTVDHPAVFDTTGAASGKIIFKPDDNTFQSKDAGEYTARYIWHPAGYADGVVFPAFVLSLVR